MPPGPWASTSNNLSCSVPNLHHIKTLACYRRVCDSGSTARLPFSRNRKLQRHRLQLTPAHSTHTVQAAERQRFLGQQGRWNLGNLPGPRPGRSCHCTRRMLGSAALTSPGGLPSPRPNEAFSRPSPRAGSRVQTRWASKTSSALAAAGRLPAVHANVQRSPAEPDCALHDSPGPPPIRPPHKQVPDLVAGVASVLEAWTDSSGLFCSVQHRIHMRALPKMCRPRFCPSRIAGEVSNVASLAPQTGMQREPPSKQG